MSRSISDIGSLKPFYLVKDGLQLSDSVSELFVFGAKRLQLILQLSLLLPGETEMLKLLLQLRAMVRLLLKWRGVRQTMRGATGLTSQARWYLRKTVVIQHIKSRVFTCRSCATASSNCWILPCRVSISSLLAVIFSCMSMAVLRPKVEARPRCKDS